LYGSLDQPTGTGVPVALVVRAPRSRALSPGAAMSAWAEFGCRMRHTRGLDKWTSKYLATQIERPVRGTAINRSYDGSWPEDRSRPDCAI